MNYKEQLSHFSLRELTKPRIANDIANELATESLAQEKSQVIIHLSYNIGLKVRIWPSTFLICQQTGFRAKLLHVYNVARYPEWSYLPAHHTFSLLFEGLPKGCSSFDILEDIPESNELYIGNIARNTTDVYTITFQ